MGYDEFDFDGFDGSDDVRHEPAFDDPAEYVQLRIGRKTNLVFQPSQNGFDQLSAGIELVLPEGTVRGGVRLKESEETLHPENNLRVQIWIDLNKNPNMIQAMQGRQFRLSIQGNPYIFQAPDRIDINPDDDRPDPLPYFVEEHVELMGMRTPTEEGNLLVGSYVLQGTQIEMLPKAK